MAEDEGARASPFAGSGGAFLAATLGTVSDNPRVDALLDRQVALADLQIDDLQKKDAFELSHLRFRRFSDAARFALEIAGFLVVALIVAGLGTMVWNAAQDRDLVVDAFSVPPDSAATGMTGAVLAGRVLDRYGAMQAGTLATTQDAGNYRGAGTEEARVEIPDTGVSIGEIDRMLRGWLGREIHITGDLVHGAKDLTLTVRYGAAPGTTFEGSDLDVLVQKAAEHLFAVSRPLRYGEYLTQQGRAAEGLAVIVPLAARGDDKSRALAYADWAQVLLRQGAWWSALDKAREAVRLDPQNPTAWGWLQAADGDLGHEEAAYRESVAVIPLWRGPGAAAIDPATAAGAPYAFAAYTGETQGDYRTAVASYEASMRDGKTGLWDFSDSLAEDRAYDHDIGHALLTAALIKPNNLDGKANPGMGWAALIIAEMSGNWSAALAQQAMVETLMQGQPFGAAWIQRYFRPERAYLLARTGDFAAAAALIAGTPADCDFCLRVRGRVAAMQGHWADAARDFATVSARSPHIPFADTDWGEMLLAKGDPGGAIAHFDIAHRRSPHNADALELWGEALIRENRSDLALPKFEEAARDAPDWGRLHLQWGEALLWSGDKAAAARQFAIAASLFLAAPDRATLARLGEGHG